jgi:hypothetical protein
VTEEELTEIEARSAEWASCPLAHPGDRMPERFTRASGINALLRIPREDVPLLLDHAAQLGKQLAERELEIRGLCRQFGIAGYPAEQMRALGRAEVEDTRGD